jgi:hypothetical protein
MAEIRAQSGLRTKIVMPKIMTGELAPARHVPEQLATRCRDQDHIRHMMQRR